MEKKFSRSIKSLNKFEMVSKKAFDEFFLGLVQVRFVPNPKLTRIVTGSSVRVAIKWLSVQVKLKNHWNLPKRSQISQDLVRFLPNRAKKLQDLARSGVYRARNHWIQLKMWSKSRNIARVDGLQAGQVSRVLKEEIQN